jgi:hypothetical protein
MKISSGISRIRERLHIISVRGDPFFSGAVGSRRAGKGGEPEKIRTEIIRY